MLTGTIMKVYCFSDKYQKPWASFLLKTKTGEKVRASGTISRVCGGEKVSLNGKYITDEKYGKQYKFTEGTVLTENENEWIVRYLCSGLFKNVGAKRARDLVEKYGLTVMEQITENPEKIKLRGMGISIATSIRETHLENMELYHLFHYLNGEITLAAARKLYKVYGRKLLDTLKKDPYLIIHSVDGFSFKKADKLALSSGMDKYSKERMAAAIEYIISEKTEKMLSNCFATFEEMRECLAELFCPLPSDYPFSKTAVHEFVLQDYKTEDEFIFYAKKSIMKSRRVKSFDKLGYTAFEEDMGKWYQSWVKYLSVFDLVINDLGYEFLILEDNRIYRQATYYTELACAKQITHLLTLPDHAVNKKKIDSVIENIEKTKTEETKEAGYEFQFDKKQKEAVLQAQSKHISVITGGPGTGKTTLIKIITQTWKGEVTLCAPTGRAAQRMMESTGCLATTIHRLKAKKANAFAEENELIIVDESSMLDLYLAEKILKYANDAYIVFVGDVNQLPSVGIGSFFKNLVDSPYIPTVRLEVSHRNEGRIALNAELIKKGKHVKSLLSGPDFEIITSTPEMDTPYKREEFSINTAVEEYLLSLNKFPVNEIMCLAPSNKDVDRLNKTIREIINPSGKDTEWNGFRVNDRVMQTKNDYNILVTDEHGEPYYGVFNGDIGTVKAIDPEAGTLTIQFDNHATAVFDEFQTRTLTLAYALTIHKSQGCESSKIIIVYGWRHYILLSRMSFYTAVTRGKKEVVIIGEEKAINLAISNDSEINRNTTLPLRLEEAVKKGTAI